MTRERAKTLASKWSAGCVCSLREGEAEEYHKMFYDILREKQYAKPETNADRIRAMSDEELEDFLIRIEGEKPWSTQFSEKFCDNCPTTTYTAEGYSHPIELSECDFTDGKCPHGTDIVWWLKQPAEEE